MGGKVKEHAFSIEMRSKEHLKKVSVSNKTHEGVLIEGYLGELLEINMVEGVIFEIMGINGTMRVDLDEEDLRKILAKKEK
jgi:hypothetical protein